MKELSVQEREFLMECLAKGEAFPDDFNERLFPNTQKEYELRYAGKMRKEDLLADEDGSFAVPLQVEKVYNGKRKKYPDDWQNMIVFGDNLQLLKTIFKNDDPLIKNKVKGKVKLIYIDPPFGTTSDFEGSFGQKAYTDKIKDADFIEYIRRRLILAKEILSDKGTIFLHLDWKKCHYIKTIMDEIFGENNFINEIIWHYADNFQGNVKGFATNHNTIFWYSNTSNYSSNKVFIPLSKKTKRDKRVWSSELGKLVSARNSDGSLIYEDFMEKKADDVWDIGQSSTTKSNSSEYIGYPTQKPEELLRRVILSSTNENDIVLDFFAGSGTTAAVAEKLNRRWITCDIGKYSYYTVQKRLLTIENSKNMENSKKKYGKSAHSFVTVTTGMYDLKKMQELNKDRYVDFVLQLFEVKHKETKRRGVIFHGERKDGYPVLVWDYWNNHDSNLDLTFLDNLHENIGKSIGKRLYIIAPANAVDFVSDFHEIDEIRYYFLKIPYQIIRELHAKDFEKIRQPRNRNKINDNELNNAIGFHFSLQPEVVSSYKNKTIIISQFYTNFKDEEVINQFENFESLSMVIIDTDFNSEDFVMTECHFIEDDEIKKSNGKLSIPVTSPRVGEKICVIYIDIFGNEFREIINTKLVKDHGRNKKIK
jgi:site-specific DNA-methyltransferase (adenine-specific)/adenine-specific DNA-methyltransferase